MSARGAYDVVIVGGGPAGISTALHLQRRAPEIAGRAVVLEKKTYPRDKYCAGAIGARADHKLAEIGVEVDVPSAPAFAMSLGFGGGRSVLVREEAPIGRVVRRLEFDHGLARVAMDRGIEVREGAPVTSIEPTECGARVRLDGGEVLDARVVVGADGVGGIVRREAGFSRGRLRAQAVELDTEPTDRDPPGDALHFDFRFRNLHGYAWDFPTVVGGERKVCRGVYLITERRHEPIKTWLTRYLAERGLDVSRYRLKQYAERGFEPGEPISRPHLLLVGEAAGIDICTGEGIPQAIAYGRLAAHYLARAFESGDFDFSDWREEVRASGVGRRLMVRYNVYKWFYGPERRRAEEMTLASSEMVRAGARDFAGLPIPRSLLARGIARLAPRLMRHGPRLAWNALWEGSPRGRSRAPEGL